MKKYKTTFRSCYIDFRSFKVLHMPYTRVEALPMFERFKKVVENGRRVYQSSHVGII